MIKDLLLILALLVVTVLQSVPGLVALVCLQLAEINLYLKEHRMV